MWQARSSARWRSVSSMARSCSSVARSRFPAGPPGAACWPSAISTPSLLAALEELTGLPRFARRRDARRTWYEPVRDEPGRERVDPLVQEVDHLLIQEPQIEEEERADRTAQSSLRHEPPCRPEQDTLAPVHGPIETPALGVRIV